jgi:hypothetical protein
VLLVGADAKDACLLAAVPFRSLQIYVAEPMAYGDCPPVAGFDKRVRILKKRVLEEGWQAALDGAPFDAVIHMAGHFTTPAAPGEPPSDSSSATELLYALLAHVRDGGWFVSLNPAGTTPDFDATKALARRLVTGNMPSALSSVVTITLYRDSVFVRKIPAEFANMIGPPIRSGDSRVQAVSDDGGEWLECTKAKWAPPPVPKRALHDFAGGGCAAVGKHFA